MRVRMTVALLGFAAVACDPVHRISWKAAPRAVLDAECVAAALVPLKGSRRSWCGTGAARSEPHTVFVFPVGQDEIHLNIPLDSAKGQPVELIWLTIQARSRDHIAEVRRVMGGAYEAVASRCGGLPPVSAVDVSCWHDGCR